MKTATILKDKINSGQLTLGALGTDHVWPGLVEICKRAGLDYLIVDCEHGPHTDADLAAACQLGRLIDFPVLVRPISCAYEVLRRAIDMGPCGLMLPSVDSTKQLDMIREAIYLPPRGRRRPGGWANHWMTGLQYEDWKTEVEDQFVVLPQIESLEGLANVEAIAADELVTAIAVGPYDLSAELGCCWQPSDSRLVDALARIRSAGTAAGKNMWMIGDGPTLVQQGYSFICVGDPMGILSQRLGQIVSASNEAHP